MFAESSSLLLYRHQTFKLFFNFIELSVIPDHLLYGETDPEASDAGLEQPVRARPLAFSSLAGRLKATAIILSMHLFWVICIDIILKAVQLLFDLLEQHILVVGKPADRVL